MGMQLRWQSARLACARYRDRYPASPGVCSIVVSTSRCGRDIPSSNLGIRTLLHSSILLTLLLYLIHTVVLIPSTDRPTYTTSHYLLTFLPTYLLTYLPTYLLTYFPTFLLSYFPTYVHFDYSITHLWLVPYCYSLPTHIHRYVHIHRASKLNYLHFNTHICNSSSGWVLPHD